uniref:Uncharacterized protein n=1 Tax=Picea glauca TaxID=3330 RepID=A0A101LWC7_PICGL|nr:hypothetical protein ABT39_MTgene1647 [Picea glauca]QHR87924.1 hypothetical protein Q903MT_gene1936 [Picea sitchensis]
MSIRSSSTRIVLPRCESNYITPIKIPHCTLSIYLSPLSAACSSYESEIEQWGGYNSESAITVVYYCSFCCF